MRVQKRGNRGFEEVKFDKITARIKVLSVTLEHVDPIIVARATIGMLCDGITTEELDRISAEIAESFKTIHPDYSRLAARILISNLHKTTPASFSECTRMCVETHSEAALEYITANAAAIDAMIIHNNDYLFDYFGYRILEASYLNKRTIPATRNGTIVYTYTHASTPIDVPANLITISASGRPVFAGPNGIVAVRPQTRTIIYDRPQYMFMRIAVALYMNTDGALESIRECYTALSEMYMTHATPTLFNACARMQQMNSCFLYSVGDSIEEIMRALTQSSLISKRAGGIGLHMSDIRTANSIIKGTGGIASGLPKQLKMFNDAAVCWDQGGRRKGSFAIYVEPWHGDILAFLSLKLNAGADSERARDLFYALWVPDLFVSRADTNANWSLFSASSAPGLSDVYDGMRVCAICNYCANAAYAKYSAVYTGGVATDAVLDGRAAPMSPTQRACAHNWAELDVFTLLYTYYEREGLAEDVIPAGRILDAVCACMRDSGTPYILFKDHANRMSAHEGVGTLKGSNLCTEIFEWSSPTSIACCTLASINLKRFLVKNDDGTYDFDFAACARVTRLAIRNLNRVIDVNVYPVDECIKNSANLRPVGLGVQALADVFAIMRIPFISTQAAALDYAIAETIYYAAIDESCVLARKYGSFEGFENSPAARGELQFDLWSRNQRRIGAANINPPYSGRYDWDSMRTKARAGLRMSLHVTYMPTVSTSQIMGNNESFEPFSSNLYTKNTIAGKFTITNAIMIQHLIELDIWNNSIKNKIIDNNGSVQAIAEIPADIREIYRTVYEIKQLELMKRASTRGAFIDQGQSLNIYLTDNSNRTLRGVFFAGWKLGLKTGSYYTRSMVAVKPMKNNIAETARKTIDVDKCVPGCESCSS